MERNEFYLLRYIYENGHKPIRNIAKDIDLSIGSVSSAYKNLKLYGFVDENGVSTKGKEALNKYKVNSAIILAAGPSTRFAPLSFEKNKGMFEVKGEILIERQIKQLKEAGVKNIILVLGYKKESFFYLSEKYDLKIIINPYFDIKNNSESLYLARTYFKNSYICSCDQYFTVNPFHEFEYETFYTAILNDKKTEEPYVLKGSKGRIIGVLKGKRKGAIILGFSYWNEEFGEAFKKLLEDNHEQGTFERMYWENIFFENIKNLPPMYISLRKEETIFEFDNLNQLRKFDDKYIEHTSSQIMKNISNVLNCKEGEIMEFLPIKEGMTNTSYTFIVKGKKYVYRHPGLGTEEIIKRENEKKSVELAKKLNIDPSYIYMNSEKGWKISSFIEDTRTPNYKDFNDSKLIIQKMHELHKANYKVDWKFRPWEDALEMEKIVKSRQPIDMSDFEELKSKIKKIYESTLINNDIEPRFCHCDTYEPNWLISKKNNKVTLIDWEYAGEADPGVDVGYYIVDALYDFNEAKAFIKEYLGNAYSLKLEQHFISYVAIIAYYWFVWALFRETCGAIMGEALYNWYFMAKKYSNYVLKEYDI